MAKIKSSDIFDKDIQASINAITEAEKNLITVTKQLADAAKELKKAYDATGIKNLTDLNKQHEAQLKSSNVIEQNAIELQLKKKELQAATITNKRANIKLLKEQAAAATKNANEAAKLASAYQKESQQLNDLRKKAKDVAITHGLMSKEFKAVQKEVVALDSKLKKVDAALGQNQRNVGNYKSALSGATNILGQFGIALGAGNLLMKGFASTLKSSQAAGDGWNRTVGEINGSMSKFFQMIGTGDFSNFIENMRNASSAGRQLADALDDIFESNLGLQTAESLTRSLIEDQIKIRNSVLSTRDERIAAAKEINRLESVLTAQRMAVTQKEFDAYADNIEKQTGLDRKQLIQFIESYNQQDELRERVVSKLKTIQNLEGQGITSTGNIATDAVRNVFMKTTQGVDGLIASINQSFTAEERKYADFLQKYEKTTDESVSNVINSWNKLRDVKTAEVQETQRNNRQLAGFEKDLAEEKIKANEKIAESFGSKATLAPELSPYIQGLTAENETSKSVLDVRQEIMDEAMDEMVVSEAKAALEIIELEKETTKQLVELEKDRQRQRQELMMQTVDLAATLFDTAFELGKEKLQRESEAITEEYDKRLTNEQLSQEQRDAIEAEREKKLNENKKKQRELEKKQFLVAQAFKVGEIVMSTYQTVGMLALKMAEVKAAAVLNPLLLPGIPIVASQIAMAKLSGALSVAAVLAQSVPKFDNGSDYTPSTFWAGEKRPEFVRKNNRTMFVDKPTLFSGDEWKGSQVVSGADTEKILANENNKALRSAIMSGRKSDNGIMMINALNGIKSEVKKQRLNVRVNSSQDIKSTIWYKNIRN